MAEAPPLPADPALFLDVDGTLVEIAATPEMVRVAPGLLTTLAHLVLERPVALVSGRRIADIDRLFAPLVLPAAGAHGLERRRGDGTLERKDAVELVRPVLPPLAAFAAEWPGVRLEDKGLSVALHYRLAPEAEEPARRIAEAVAAESQGWLKVLAGKMVYELTPRLADKGTAVAAFMSEPPFAGKVPVFLGDDVTDEDGFDAVDRMGGLSVLVGAREGSRARFRLPSVPAAHAWLGRLLEAERARRPARSASE
jgi:trehalose 6-phosphate phosphatase